MAGNTWFDINKEGFRKTLERRGKAFAIFELAQNPWDEDGTTEVSITLPRPEHGKSVLTVTDDAPQGYRDLSESYTIYAESYKKNDPTKRGAFDVGDKCVLALCEEATITSTTGRVTFDRDGTRRRTSAVKRERGSEFRAELKLKISDWDEMRSGALKLIPPVPTFFNGTQIAPRTPLGSWVATLPTVKADEEGNLRPTERKTTISLYAVEPGETPRLYEMGIPVVEFDCKYHVSIGQKVPINVDRDNVPPSFASRVLVEVLNHTAESLSEEEAKQNWVTSGASDPRCKVIKTVMDTRFGKDRYSYNPNDPESNKIAISKGSMVIHGSVLPAGMWENAKRDGAIAPPPPSPKAHFSQSGRPPIERDKWTNGMTEFEQFAIRFARVVIGKAVCVTFYSESDHWKACYGDNGLCVAKKNCGGNRFFDGGSEAHYRDWVELLIHEFAHDSVSDHLSNDFHEECCRIGATYAAHLQRQLVAQNGDDHSSDQPPLELRA